MRIFIFILICIAGFSACSNEIKLSDRNVVNEFFEENISGIGVQDGFELFLGNGDESKILIEADENIITCVKHEMKNGILYFFKDSDKEFPSNASVKIYIYNASLKTLKASKSKIYISDVLKTDDLEINLSNSSVIEGRTECRQLRSTVSSSTVKLSGTVEYVSMDILGGSLVASGIQAIDANLNISGGSIVNMDVSNELEIYARNNSRFYGTVGVFRSVVLDDDSKINNK